tara:strand:+ start:493 stop:1185 length:693 start_codon:yes stop_codon:yes gene_type:complete
MSYPLVIKDNFFLDPDAIVKLTESFTYFSKENNWPGGRTKSLYDINYPLASYISQQIFGLIHDKLPSSFTLEIGFQKVNPFVIGDKWNRKNLGWIHTDNCLFGGIIYLDKNPDKDSGTSMYKLKYGYGIQTDQSRLVKENHFAGKQIDDEEYNIAFDVIRNQYEETLRIPNLYNRLILIPGDQPHGVTTFGDKERNTIVFFCLDTKGVLTPELKGQCFNVPNYEVLNQFH